MALKFLFQCLFEFTLYLFAWVGVGEQLGYECRSEGVHRCGCAGGYVEACINCFLFEHNKTKQHFSDGGGG